MPFRRGFGGARRGGRRRRGMDWISAASTGVTTLAPGDIASGYVVLPSQLREQFTDPTLVRTRGVIKWTSANGIWFGAAGIIAWADRDDTPPTDPPRPFMDPDLDWLWHGYVFGTQATVSAPVAELQQSPFGTLYPIDSKAMRKIGSDKGILIVFQNASVSSVSPVFSWGARCLFKDS